MLDLETLRRRSASGESFDYLFFWGHRPSKTGETTRACLSQWYVSPFTVEGVLYPTAEHWMMASKARLFGDDEALGQILETSDPGKAKAMGRKVRNFDDTVWKQNARRLVTEGNLAKFRQNAELQKFLLGTADTVLVEASPYDRIWGIGLRAEDDRARNPATWRGQNLLGFSLMDVRSQIAEEQGASRS